MNQKNYSFSEILSDHTRKEHDLNEGLNVLDWELFLYDTQPPCLAGLNKEFICGARLDNLLSCHTIITALVEDEPTQNCLIVLNDHEEVGSVSTSGAQGNFLRQTLERLLPDPQQQARCLARSILVSTDNAHAVHPNFSDKHDKEHLPSCNKGPVIKSNANQRYASNAVTASFFRSLCKSNGIPVQEFVMRNDLACGSTIGPLTAGETGIRTVDVGVPTLGMHSIRELAGSKDPEFLASALHFLFQLPENDPLWQSLAL